MNCPKCGCKTEVVESQFIDYDRCLACGHVPVPTDVSDEIKENDPVNHPAHYTQGGIETIDYLKAKLSPSQYEGYILGNVLKYCSRYNLKNGFEDLKKAQWYLNKLIAEKENTK